MQSYPLRVRGLKQEYLSSWHLLFCRILYGYVDWNSTATQAQINTKQVVSFTGTWIETRLIEQKDEEQKRRILYGYVDWNYDYK